MYFSLLVAPGQKEVVDLTKGYGSSVVDLTGDDSPIQVRILC